MKEYNKIHGRPLVFGDREQINYIKQRQPMYEGKEPIYLRCVDEDDDLEDEDADVEFDCINKTCERLISVENRGETIHCECGWVYEERDGEYYLNPHI